VAAWGSFHHKPGIKAIAKDPVLCSTYMCAFQAGVIGVQFWMLILTNDWQHTATLVLLMFANYMILAKIFKDRVIIGRIYRPSLEDQQLPVRLMMESQQQGPSS
jgi:Putative transmembrane protein